MPREPGLQRPCGGGPDERHAVLATLPGTHEQAAVRGAPVLDEQVQQFIGTESCIGQDQQ